jgi:ketol-acid reductoisomerase
VAFVGLRRACFVETTFVREAEVDLRRRCVTVLMGLAFSVFPVSWFRYYDNARVFRDAHQYR